MEFDNNILHRVTLKEMFDMQYHLSQIWFYQHNLVYIFTNYSQGSGSQAIYVGLIHTPRPMRIDSFYTQTPWGQNGFIFEDKTPDSISLKEEHTCSLEEVLDMTLADAAERIMNNVLQNEPINPHRQYQVTLEDPQDT